MESRDLFDMSFEVFYNGLRASKERDPHPHDDDAAPPGRVSDVERNCFFHGVPRLNLRKWGVVLFIPPYRGSLGSKKEVVAVQDGKAIPLGSLRTSPLTPDETLPTVLELAPRGVRPLGGFSILIDGKKVYEIFPFAMFMFDESGYPMRKIADEVRIVHPSNKYLWLTKARIVTTTDFDDLRVDTVVVEPGGYVRLRDRPQPEPGEAEEEEEPAGAPKRVRATIAMPPAETVAHALVDGRAVPLYPAVPEVTIRTEGAPEREFVVRVFGTETTLRGLPRALEGAKGLVRLTVLRDGRRLASTEFYVVPGFSCTYSDRGDIPSTDEIEVSMCGRTFPLDIYSDGAVGPYDVDGVRTMIRWNIPAVTYDLGDGPRPFRGEALDVDLLPETILFRVRGVERKTLFIGSGHTCKKVNITPDWDDEAIRLSTGPLKEAVFDSPTRHAILYITVNSFPVRRFLTFENRAFNDVAYEDGAVTVNVIGSGKYACKVYNLDKRVDEVELGKGETVVPVSQAAVEAEITEEREGRKLSSSAVKIIETPFLNRDLMGDVWLHVSKDKRIPLPDDLLERSAMDLDEVRTWHSLVVRLNPELRRLPTERVVGAFRNFLSGQRGRADRPPHGNRDGPPRPPGHP